MATPTKTPIALILLVLGCGGGGDATATDAGETRRVDAGETTGPDAAGLPDVLDCAAISNYPAGSRVLEVGPGKAHETPSDAASVAQDGDVIEIAAGTYTNDFAQWQANHLTLRGVGGRAHLQATQTIPNGKAIWVIQGSEVRVENIEFSGARVNDENGAGIRAEGEGLSICNSNFHDNENGILGGEGELLIEHSEFNHNGLGDVGQTHNMYINGSVTTFTLRHSYTHHAVIGHNLKTRAQENYILYNRIMDEADGNSSYAMDFSNGGLTYVIGNVVQQSANTDNSTMLRYGAEGLGDARINELYVVNNTFVNDRGSGNFVNTAAPAVLINNLFVGGGTVLLGDGTQTTNLETSDGLVDRAGFDYHLEAGAAAIGAGSAPGSAHGFDMEPNLEYEHPMWRKLRKSDGAIDVGAHEFE